MLVVGQTPPPLGGQAVMIKRFLEGKYPNLELFHVRMGFAKDMEDLGKIRLFKIFHLFEVVFKIFYLRFTKNIKILYYPPSGADKIPMYRDIIILTLTRWVFKKTIFHFHASGISEFWDKLTPVEKFFYKLAYFNCDLAISLSPHAPNDAQFLKAKRACVIPNGIENNFNDSLRTKKDEEPINILFVGLLRETKGEFVLLNACNILKNNNISFKLNIAGKFGSEIIKKRFFSVINEYKLSQHINYLGQVTGSEKNMIFANSDIFCFPSYFESETFPVVLIEAMQFGLPVVSTKWRGIPGIIDDSENGFLVEIKDAEAIAQKLKILILDNDLRNKMRKNCFKKYAECFTIEKFHENMYKCLMSVF